MNKHTVISVIAIIALIIPFAYSGMNIYAAQQLQYRWHEPERFSFFEMSNNEEIKLCSAVPYPADIKNFKIDVFYRDDNKGTYTLEDIRIDGSESTERGKFSSDNFIEAQHLFMTMDFQFDGGDMRVDISELFIVVSIETPIIGVIPYTSVTQYTGLEFDQLMNQSDC